MSGSKGARVRQVKQQAINQVPSIPDGTIMTTEFAATVARDAYVWGSVLINARHRRASFAKAPEPGLQGGILPVAPTGYVSTAPEHNPNKTNNNRGIHDET